MLTHCKNAKFRILGATKPTTSASARHDISMDVAESFVWLLQLQVHIQKWNFLLHATSAHSGNGQLCWDGTGTFCAQDLSFPRAKGPYGEDSFPRPFVLLFHGPLIPRNFRSQDLSFPGTFVPTNNCSWDLSFSGSCTFLSYCCSFSEKKRWWSRNVHSCCFTVKSKKANCITVKLPVNKLIQAYGSVNSRRLGCWLIQ